MINSTKLIAKYQYRPSSTPINYLQILKQYKLKKKSLLGLQKTNSELLSMNLKNPARI